MIAKLALEDGCVFTGRSFGAPGTRTGEVVFNTSMTGYQEILTDPSYCGQIVTMTFPLIGNYGVNPGDFESVRPFLSGMVVKELPTRPSNFAATGSLADLLADHGIMGLCDVDTRALTRRVRMQGALRGVLSTEILDDVQLVNMASQADAMVGANLVERVSPGAEAQWEEPLRTCEDDGGSSECGAGSIDRRANSIKGGAVSSGGSASRRHIVAIDCGIKHNILRYLVSSGARVTVVPSGTSAGRIKEHEPDGILVGNGPGDPGAVTQTIDALRELIGTYPIFGICLGHQMLALALGADTYILKFGHHGANHPVMNHRTDRVEITAQNHGFAVDAASLTRVGGIVTHTNLNDESLEGFAHPDKQLMAVQFHPEAGPGPNDSTYLFETFLESM